MTTDVRTVKRVLVSLNLPTKTASLILEALRLGALDLPEPELPRRT
jgi:hypothetical protein